MNAQLSLAEALHTRGCRVDFVLGAGSEDRLFGDPFFLAMLRGAQTEIAAAGLQLVFVVASNHTESEHFENYAGGGHVDGVLLLSLHGDDRLPQHLEAMGVPTVLSGRPFSGSGDICYVDADNLGGGRAATTLLVERGARTIATITGPQDMCVGQDRLQGYQAALAQARRRTRKSLVVQGDFSVEGGYQAIGITIGDTFAEEGVRRCFAEARSGSSRSQVAALQPRHIGVVGGEVQRRRDGVRPEFPEGDGSG